MRLQKDFKLGDDVRLGLFADVFNLLNDDAHTATQSDRGTTEDLYHQPEEFIQPRRVMLGAKLRF